MSDVIVIGGGAAGLMAAINAAKHGAETTLLEKMPSVGRKILITGKGRCNFTNRCDLADFPACYPGNGSFLFSALRSFSNQDVIDFFDAHGVPSKIERGGRLFPASDKAADIVGALYRAAKQLGVQITTNCPVAALRASEGEIAGIVLSNGKMLTAAAVVLATGGLSYPATGSSGDGYRMVKELGHTVTALQPALVPLETNESWVKELQGLSLKNVEGLIRVQGKKMDSEFGEMLFTHFGISGPIVLSLSHAVSAASKTSPGEAILFELNLKPALSPETLDKRLQRDFSACVRKQFKNSLGELLPQKMIPVFIQLSGIKPDKPVHQITREERTKLVELLQKLTLTIKGTRPVAEAIVTAGGISVKEIQPKTMSSRLIRGLFFAGEIIDVDGYTGGYNLQSAFSTGYVAGKFAAEYALTVPLTH